MNKHVVLIVVVIVALAAVTIYYIHESHNRFTIVNSGPGIAYEIDKKTGRTWKIQGDKKIEHTDRAGDTENIKLPGRNLWAEVFGDK